MSHTTPLAAKPIKVGWARADITPTEPVQLHGQAIERISQGVHDPLTATVLALESVTGEQAIMVSCDLVNIGREQVTAVRQRVGELVPEIQTDKLLINCTHTHTGPTLISGAYRPAPQGVMTPEAYVTFFVERIAQATLQAWQQRRMAGMSRAVGHAAIGFNRRVVYKGGKAKMYGTSDTDEFVRIESGMDPGIELLFFWDHNQQVSGIVVNVACPSQVVENKYYLSADYWHPARLAIREYFGENVQVYPMCSAAGDLSPRDLVRRGRNEPSMRDISGMQVMGRRLARAVIDAFEFDQTPVQCEVVFHHEAIEAVLPKRIPTPEEIAEARATLEKLPADAAEHPGPPHWDYRRARRVLDRVDVPDEQLRYSANLHVMRLGDVAIVTNPFELFLEYGQRIKARSRANQTLVVQLTNDRGMYLPTPEAVAGGHYSAMIYDNTCGPEAGDLLVEKQVELINANWPSA